MWRAPADRRLRSPDACAPPGLGTPSDGSTGDVGTAPARGQPPVRRPSLPPGRRRFRTQTGCPRERAAAQSFKAAIDRLGALADAGDDLRARRVLVLARDVVEALER